MTAPRRALLGALATLVALSLPARAPAARHWESIESLPGHRTVTVTVKKKPRTYFHLTPQAPLTVTIAGPARLRVISRAVISGPPGAMAAYEIVALEGGKTLLSSHEQAGAIRGVRATGAAVVAAGRHMIVPVPDGTHTIQLALSGTPEALVRLQRSVAPSAPEAWVSLTPVRAARSVTVVEGEKSIAYYSALPGQPVVLRVVGPCTLDCITRLDYDPTMRGQQAYRLRVAERGRTLRNVDFRTTKSGAATYAGLDNRVPSKLDRFSLTVGGGLHEIELHLARPANGSVEIHARIPQPSVGNTE